MLDHSHGGGTNLLPLVSIMLACPASLSIENKSHRAKVQNILFAGVLSSIQNQKHPNLYKHNQAISMLRTVDLWPFLTVLC